MQWRNGLVITSLTSHSLTALLRFPFMWDPPVIPHERETQ
jgi:hypothetical protein